jgi:hypothetical protein
MGASGSQTPQLRTSGLARYRPGEQSSPAARRARRLPTRGRACGWCGKYRVMTDVERFCDANPSQTVTYERDESDAGFALLPATEITRVHTKAMVPYHFFEARAGHPVTYVRTKKNLAALSKPFRALFSSRAADSFPGEARQSIVARSKPEDVHESEPWVRWAVRQPQSPSHPAMEHVGCCDNHPVRDSLVPLQYGGPRGQRRERFRRGQ